MPREQRPYGVGRLRALADPVVDALLLDIDERRLGARVVVAQDFDEAAVAGGARVGHHDAEERALLGTGTAQTNRYHLSVSFTAREARSPRSWFAARAPRPRTIRGCAASAWPGGGRSCRRQPARPSRRATSTSSASARTASADDSRLRPTSRCPSRCACGGSR